MRKSHYEFSTRIYHPFAQHSDKQLLPQKMYFEVFKIFYIVLLWIKII